MKKHNPIPLIAVVFIIIIAVVFVTLVGIGSRYRSNLSGIAPKTNETTAAQKKTQIKKIRIKDENNCYEVTPDGVVRIYAGCGENLTDAVRLADAKNILQLFKLASENDLSKYATSGPGKVYELTIETDEGTRTFLIVVNSETAGVIGAVAQTITQIVADTVHPSPSPSAVSSSGTGPVPSSSIFPSPSSGGSGGSSPSPLPGGATPLPFTCNFSQDANGKPFRVSNVVCTDEPI